MELMDEIAGALDTSRKEAKVLLETILEGMVRALRSGERVEIRGFGSFNVSRRAPRKGRNPRTGTPVEIPARTGLSFRASKELKELLANPPGGDGRPREEEAKQETDGL